MLTRRLRDNPGMLDKTDTVRQALLLVQIVEAIIKALEIYPVEILETGRRDPDTNGRFRVHMRTTGSHAKLVWWRAVVSMTTWLPKWRSLHEISGAWAPLAARRALPSS